MGLILPAAVLQWWKAGLGLILGFVLCWPLASCQGERKGRAAEANAWALKAADVARKAVEVQRVADAAWNVTRMRDLQILTRNRQEVDNALASIPDQALTPRQRARVCVELRRQNAPASAIAAACGPAQPTR